MYLLNNICKRKYSCNDMEGLYKISDIITKMILKNQK